jgi:hypothetical protein
MFGMPHGNSSFELKVKNYPLAYLMSVLVPFVFVMVIFTYITMSGRETSTELTILIMTSWTIAFLFCALKSKRMRSLNIDAV